MTVYNGSRYLVESIKSVLNQTLKNFEFLIIDDNSKDNSVEIIKSFNDQRINLVLNEINIGQTRSLNKGIELSKGDYISRLDQDDLFEGEKLEKQMNFFKDNPQIVLLGTSGKLIDNHGITLGKFYTKTNHKDIIRYILIDNPFAHSSVVFKKNIVHSIFCYDQSLHFSQDFDLWVRLASEGYIMANLPGNFVSIRIHENQTSKIKKFQIDKINEELFVIEKIFSLPDLSNYFIILLKIKVLLIKKIRKGIQYNNILAVFLFKKLVFFFNIIIGPKKIIIQKLEYRIKKYFRYGIN